MLGIYVYIHIYIYRGYIGDIWGLYWDNGKWKLLFRV